MFEAIQGLPKETQAEVYNAIFDYSLNFKEPELQGISQVIWKLVEPVLTKGNTNFINGKQPKQKRNGSETEATDKPNESQPEAYKDKDKDKDEYKDKDKNIDRSVSNETKPKSFKQWSIDEFKQSIADNRLDYPKEMLNAFFGYWTELNASGKPKYSTEKTWETPKRLKRWHDNNNKFTPSKPQPTQFNRSSANHYK